MAVNPKKVLFIDRDGTIIVEPPDMCHVNTLEQLEFLPSVLRNLYFIRHNLDFEWVLVANHNGFLTDSFQQKERDNVQRKFMQTLTNEGIYFNKIFIDKPFPEGNLSAGKADNAMLKSYFTGAYDMGGSFVIGNRITDVQMAKNLGCKAIFINKDEELLEANGLKEFCALQTTDWNRIAGFLFAGERTVRLEHKTHETSISLELNLDGTGKTDINTGLKLFDHLLDLTGKYSGCDLKISVDSSLGADEHHTIEGTATILGEALLKALADKRGIERYGFMLPVDDSMCQVVLDFGGRAWLDCNVEFKREYVGDFPTEMLTHFFKSISDAACMNLHIRADGNNEHHKMESIFKAFAKAIKMAINKNIYKY